MTFNFTRIYIAGKITGLPFPEVQNKFNSAHNSIGKLGIAVVNPLQLGCQPTWSYEQCKPYCYEAIRNCTHILMLPDHKDSPGALDEMEFAVKNNLEVIHATGDITELLTELIILETISPSYD